ASALFDLVMDCRQRLLRRGCRPCSSEGVGLARVWLRRVDDVGDGTTCVVVAVEAYPPYRRELAPTTRPVPPGADDLSSKDPNVRIYQTRERQNYHTDSCDVVGLLCLRPARSGGLSSLVSTVTIFNELRRLCNLRPYETFLEMNSDPGIAHALESLYGAVANVELYPGLVAEEAKPRQTATGLCAGRTITYAILSDAVALVRGDRFLTTELNPYNLTPWGYDEVQRIERDYRRGLITDDERYNEVIEVWTKAKDSVTKAVSSVLAVVRSSCSSEDAASQSNSHVVCCASFVMSTSTGPGRPDRAT
ncbi:hypothetical protein B4Q13_15530, partial [Lacticaseibacillus rhamnosus]